MGRMDKSTRVNPRAKAPHGLGGAGNALGPKHLAQGPLGTKVVRIEASSGRSRPTRNAKGPGKARGGDNVHNALMRAIPPVTFTEDMVGQTFDFKPYFTNAKEATALTWASTTVPAGMTLDSTTGVLAGTPTTVATGTPSLTVVSGYAGDANLVVPWTWAVVAAPPALLRAEAPAGKPAPKPAEKPAHKAEVKPAHAPDKKPEAKHAPSKPSGR